MEKLPATLELTLSGMFLTVLVGSPSEHLRASRRRSTADFAIRLYSNVTYCIPVYWMGLMLQLIFGVWFDWLPIAGRTGARVFYEAHLKKPGSISSIP